MTFANKRKSIDSRGFTIVELIVVIVCIGILAGISIIGYGQWRKTVAQKQVQSDLNGIVAAMDSERNFNNAYPTALPSTFTASPGVTLYYKPGGTSTAYCIQATSVQVPTVVYYLDSTNNNKTSQAGTCP
jgi:prepilin-type N-terminal cleavage/methylation domain-containing protein